MPHTPPTRKQESDGSGPGRLGKPGTPAEGSTRFRLPAWRQSGGMAAVMAGMTTTILLGTAALGEPFCQIPFASGSPHVPGPESAILVLAAACFWTASLPTGDRGAARGQNRFPVLSTLRTSLMQSPNAPPCASSLHLTGE